MKYIFIHIPKNGGSSVVRSDLLKAIVQQPSKAKLSTSYIMETGINRAWGHSRWRNLDVSWRNSYPAFTIVRNPWAWMVSQYRFKQKILTEKKLRSENDAFDVDWSFDQFIDWLDKEKDKPSFQHLNCHRTTCNVQTQKSFIVNEAGIPCVDALRFENYNEDTMKYLELNEPLKARNITGKVHHDYKTYYNDDTRRWVQELLSEDIDHFGFTFEGGATKNYFYEQEDA